MMNRMGRLLFLLFLLLPMAAQANTVFEGGKDGLTWTFSTTARMTTDGVRYDIIFENDFVQGMITEDEAMDVEPFGQLDEDGLPWVIWSRRVDNGQFRLYMSTFNGSHWSVPQELPSDLERCSDRQVHFRLGENGRIYMTFIRAVDGTEHVMFGIYKTWSGGWTELGEVVSIEAGHSIQQPNIFTVFDESGLAQILLSFIHVYPEGEGDLPPDGDGLWDTIEQYFRVFNSGDTSPWFQVQ